MRAPILGPLRRTVIEVERKFHPSDLTTQKFRDNRGIPPFRRLEHLGKREFEDVYFDRDNQLSANGIWVRKRDGHWQAKIRPDAKRGSFNNSQFEEFTKTADIARMIQNRINHGTIASPEEDFGLAQIARFTTYREMWKVNDKFNIVFDQTDFGHVVGEVELEGELHIDEDEEKALRQKQAAIAKMDQEIEALIKKYSWAFPAEKPVGKLSAYFAKNR